MVYLEKRNANLALGEKQMASRSFRVFGTRKDLESVFYEFQELNLVKFYIYFLIVRINTILSSILKYKKTLILPRIYHD